MASHELLARRRMSHQFATDQSRHRRAVAEWAKQAKYPMACDEVEFFANADDTQISGRSSVTPAIPGERPFGRGPRNFALDAGDRGRRLPRGESR